MDKKGFLICLVRIPFLILLPLISGLTVKVIMESIEAQVTVKSMIIIISGMAFLLVFINWAEPILTEMSRAVAENINIKYRLTALNKMMDVDYRLVEKSDFRLKFEKSKEFAVNKVSLHNDFIGVFINFINNFLGIFTYIIILGVINPYLILILLAAGTVNFICMFKLHDVLWASHHKNMKIQHEANYLFRESIDFPAAKDVRLYSYKTLFERKLAALLTQKHAIENYRFKQNVKFNLIVASLTVLAEGSALFFLIRDVLYNGLSIANFVFYIGLVTGFWAWIVYFTNSLYRMKNQCKLCDMFRDFMELEYTETDGDEGNSGGGKNLCIGKDGPDTISFNNVFFSYDNGIEILKDINFTVKRGERVAIIGENGAGKTTLIKLLCGLLRPVSGSILFNGADISTLSKESYCGLFSAVFQDYNILPLSIEQNIGLDFPENLDSGRVNAAIDTVGLREKIDSLEDKEKTLLDKKIHKSGINFSGGETQKLLLARVIYKDAPIMVLDEPTSALDALAERNMYLKYNQFTENKFSFFISHRLASTRFCDKIMFIKNGEIVEEGSHEALIEKKGHYWSMFEMQKYYYEKEVTENAG